MKKLTKKLAALLAVVSLLALGLAACSGNPDSSSPDSGTSADSGASADSNTDPKVIGIIQLMEHPALDAARVGFVDALEENGYVDGQNIEIKYYNAQNDQSNCQTIAQTLVSNQCDLILAIATPAAQAVATVTQDIPILVTAITDPADSGLVESNEAPGGNVSGTSDLTPVKEQMELLKQLYPNVKKVGMLYTSSESNSEFQVNLAKEAAAALGIETEDYTISEANEIQQVTQSAIGKVDALYVPTDNTLAGAMTSVTQITTPAGLPVIVGEEGMVSGGGLATYGINYTELGKLTGEQAVQILKGEAEPATMPIGYLTDFALTINKTTADTLGVTIPDDLAAAATFVE